MKKRIYTRRRLILQITFKLIVGIVLLTAFYSYAGAQDGNYPRKAFVHYECVQKNTNHAGSIRTESLEVEDMNKIYLDHYTEKVLYNKQRKQHFTFRIHDVRFDIPDLTIGTFVLEGMNSPNEVYWRAGYIGAYFLKAEAKAELTIDKIEGDFIWGHFKELRLWPIDIGGEFRDSSELIIKNCTFCVDKSNMYIDSRRE